MSHLESGILRMRFRMDQALCWLHFSLEGVCHRGVDGCLEDWTDVVLSLLQPARADTALYLSNEEVD